VWISKPEIYKRFTQDQIEQFPVLCSDAIAFCVVCGEKGTEMHHWAPQSIFKDEAEKWPKDMLCLSCHKKWHKMVTPNLTWL